MAVLHGVGGEPIRLRDDLAGRVLARSSHLAAHHEQDVVVIAREVQRGGVYITVGAGVVLRVDVADRHTFTEAYNSELEKLSQDPPLVPRQLTELPQGRESTQEPSAPVVHHGSVKAEMARLAALESESG